MIELSSVLKDWLSDDISDATFSKYLNDNQENLKANISRGRYLRIKHLDRGAGRDILNKLSPCNVCAKDFKNAEELWALSSNNDYLSIECPKYHEKPQNTFGPYDLVSYWKCNNCGSVTEFVTQEKASYGKWGKVG